MIRRCEICGRPLRTGIKYCYVCRSLGRAQSQKTRQFNISEDLRTKLGLVLIIILLVFIFTRPNAIPSSKETPNTIMQNKEIKSGFSTYNNATKNAIITGCWRMVEGQGGPHLSDRFFLIFNDDFSFNGSIPDLNKIHGKYSTQVELIDNRIWDFNITIVGLDGVYKIRYIDLDAIIGNQSRHGEIMWLINDQAKFIFYPC